MRCSGVTWMVFVALLAGMAKSANSCGYHGIAVGLRTSHPKSLVVTFAIQDALAQGRMRTPQKLEGDAEWNRVCRLVTRFSKYCEASGDVLLTPTSDQPIAILLVDQGLWARMTWDHGSINLDNHIDGPASRDRVIVTGEAALQSLIDRQLTIDHLVNMGAVVVD